MSPRRAAPLTLEFVLLGLLADSPAHGYELHQKLCSLQPLSLVWNVGQAQLYALLDKLAGQELLSRKALPGNGHPDRVRYSLTAAGQSRFASWLAEPVLHARDLRQEFLAKLYFARRNGSALDLIARQRAACLAWVNSLNAQYDALNPGQLDERLVFAFRLRQVQALLDWLEDAEKWVGDEQPPA